MSHPQTLPNPTIQMVLNNNVVVTVDASGRERVLMGRGLGFQKKRGDPADASRVDKTFVLDAGERGAWERALLQDVPYDVIRAAANAVSDAERSLGRSLGRSIVIAVIDHLQFLISRLDSGMEIPAAIMPELRILHPDEAEAGREMLRSISRSMKRKFPADEAAFLTMHVLNETRDEPGANTTLLFSRVHQVTALVESTLGEPSALTRLKDSAEYARFVLHVKFMIQRIAEGIMLAGEHSAMFDVASNSYPRAYETAKRVRELISSSWEVDVTDEELLYLIVHIERLAASSQT